MQNLAYGNGIAAEFYDTLEMVIYIYIYFCLFISIFFKNYLQPSEMQDVTAQEYIETWLLQINYPEVDVILDNTDPSFTSVDFVQARFLLSLYDETFIQNIPSPFK